MTTSSIRSSLFAFGCIYPALLVGCSPAGSPTSSGKSQGTGQLTTAEWAAYNADSQYLRTITTSNTKNQLNLADARQYNVAVSRLKLAGKTPENSPYLFELIAADRQKKIASGMQAGVVIHPHTAGSGAVAMHYIEAAGIASAPAPHVATGSRFAPATSTLLASGTASATTPGGDDYNYLDISVSATDGTPVALLNYQEQYADTGGGLIGTNTTISTSGDPNASNLTTYIAESYQYEQIGEDFTESYTHTPAFGGAAPQGAGGLPQLSTPEIDAPVDTKGPNSGVPDGIISVCMDRTWTNDCDYVLNTGSAVDHRIKMPLQGAVTITTQHVFDRAKISGLKTQLDTNQVPAGTDPGQVKLVLTNVGGGCDVDAANALYSGMSGFWDYVTLSADNKTLYWAASGDAASVYFGQECTQIQNSAKLTMRIPVPILSIATNIPFTSAFTISNDPNVQRPDATLPPITLTNSCLAEGTQIDLGSGKLAPIESLHIGQSIFSPYSAAHSLTIEDTAKGTEAAPMVRIRDEAGHTLLLTEMHPVATSDRGMVQARYLRTGDVVLTTLGPSKIEASREPYSGKVYNLKVGSASEKESLSEDQTVVYANGFVVGDGQIQSKYEALAMKSAGKATEPEHVAERWRRDFVLSPHK